MPSIKSAALLIATTTILLGGLTSKTTFAASTQDKDDKHATLEEGKLRLYEKKVDSLLLERAKSQALDTTNLAIDLLDNEEMVKSDIPDSVFIKRLSSIPSLIDLPYNNVVRASILWYVIRKKNISEKILGLTGYYFPIIEQTLDKHDLPLELRYLPIIESALNPVAVSRVGATGLWQFMYGTGKQYKLNITSFVDERRDPLAASEAAAKFLKDLYKIYNDWTLVIAAYNCGPRNVNKAIRRAGGSKNYWEIYNYLPKETRGYVPNFIAAAYLVKFYKEHKLTPRSMPLPQSTDSIHVNRMLHFQQVSEVLGISVDELRELNPQYKKDIIPGIERPYTLTLPMGFAPNYIAKEEEIYAKDSLYFVQNNFPKLMAANSSTSQTSDLGTKKVFHKVRKNETFSSIAKKYGIEVAALKEWNGFSSKKKKKLQKGMRLTVYQASPLLAQKNEKPLTGESLGSKKSTSSPSDSIKIETVKDLNISPNEPAKPYLGSAQHEKGTVIQYTVKKNDNLWTIAQKYKGVTPKDIQKENRLHSPKDLKVGQILKITID
ncbi:lytic transglycosylase domain-containing protein [Acetobacteroides hydrogenigenes]|uniref:Membrane-bound lytic murein transglycosylase D n=1 Tax=Acetobacteroides hydrogenigenes TaxID=979970 RepID=A0A4R2EWU0_9BACT|nr:lytic transglycosylase domain-containing protein [Acetobacteroides hydrogenigenes]TCN73166.1 membrane-bound lytic murein transglycosylase D [Acetobacteroides hydrogenigenes]